MDEMDRYSLESRIMLDLVAMILFQSPLPMGSRVVVHSPFEWCREDLANRLDDRWNLEPDLIQKAGASVHLFDLEESSGDWTPASPVEIVVFRNRWSHKRVLYRRQPTRPYSSVLGPLRRGGFHIIDSWGISAPPEIVKLLVSNVWSRRGNHPRAIHLTDSAHIRLIRQGWWRNFSAYGVVRGQS